MSTFDSSEQDTNDQQPRYLPNDLSEANFRRYEEFIAKGVAAFPAETQFKVPPGLAPTTFVARFRSSIVSLRRFGWKTDKIDLRKLETIYGLYSVSRDFADGTIWFRVKHRAGRPTEFKGDRRAEGPADNSPIPIHWTELTDKELDALCCLLSTGKFTGPAIVKKQLSADLVLHMETTHNVAIVWHEGTQETVIT